MLTDDFRFRSPLRGSPGFSPGSLFAAARERDGTSSPRSLPRRGTESNAPTGSERGEAQETAESKLGAMPRFMRDFLVLDFWRVSLAQTRYTRCVRWIAILTTLVLAAPVRAQETEELGVTADVEGPIASTGGEDPTASATEIDAQLRPHSLDTLADALLEAPGTRALRSGAYGSPASITLRGSEADQVEVMFGDIPITSADGGAFDLSEIPLWALDRVEVYRGGAPTWLARSGIGGVLRLVPRTPGDAPAFSGAAGVGSFGLGHLRLGHAATVGDVSWIAAAGMTTSQGDFPYLADVTLLDGPDDAVERRRQNAWTTQATGLGHVRVGLGEGRLEIFLLGRGRVGGVPGRAAQPTTATHRDETQVMAGIAYAQTEGGRPEDVADWRLNVSAALGFRERRLSDPLGEIGLVPTEADDDSLRATLRLAVAGRVLPWLELIGAGLYTHENLDPSDALAGTPNQGSARHDGTLGLEARFFGRVDDVRLELRPSARISLVESRLHDLRPDHLEDPVASPLSVAPTFRLGAAIEPIRGLTIAASAASATRTPNLVELFGDRGFLVGVSTLAPERAETADLGIAVRGGVGDLRGQAELRGFVTFASDLIRYRRNTLFQAVPENVGSATLAGGELGVRGTLTPHFALTAAWTLLGTWTEQGGRERRLPLRPWLTGYVRPEARAIGVGPIDRLSFWLDLEHVSDAFWDPANTSAIEGRTRIGLGAAIEVWETRFRVDIALRDVLDQRGSDLLGFPLPGRSLSVSLALQSD